MLKILTAVFSVVLMLQTICTDASAQDKAGSVMTDRAAFRRLKELAGDWKGTIADRDEGPEILVSYRITGNGSAVIETQFPGTDHEMMTAYHMDGDRLMLTHYCALGNQPRMIMDGRSSEDRILFSFAGGTNLDAEKDRHVHNGSIRLVDDDHIECEWAIFEGGRQEDVNRFFLSRID